MDPATIAASLVALLAPFLKKAAEEFAGEAGKGAASFVQDKAKALWQRLRIVAEPGGAAAFAALLAGKYRQREGERIGIVLCGGNANAVDFTR